MIGRVESRHFRCALAVDIGTLVLEKEAAVVTGAGVIVTRNAKDFPRERVPIKIEIRPLADFAHNTLSINPSAAVRALEAVAARSGRRGMALTTEDVRDTIERRLDFVDAVAVLCSAATRDDQ